MPRSEAPPPAPPDWRNWALLAWVVAFGLLYARMILERKAPGLLAAARAWLPGGR